uniref:DOCKER Lobe C domain-containing protein n=1 Tax=Oryzias melastigma TaxID=30732 RepID=A0A3B3B7Z7_ORYME
MSTHCFPYVKKRIPVMYQHQTDLSPIEVAIDEMSCKVAELRLLCSGAPAPLANMVLEGSKLYTSNTNHTSFCRQFVDACGHALGVNERLIKEDQQEYHDEMKANYRDLTRELSNIMHEQVCSLILEMFMYEHFLFTNPVFYLLLSLCWTEQIGW